jgi:tetratricopeptide (TPR) repeat protein
MDMGDYVQAELESRALVEDGQPIEARRAGYTQLSHFYPLVGKYREALRALDRRADFFWQAKDTGGAAMIYAMKAFYRASSGHSVEEAHKELERIRPVESRVTHPSYWGYKFLFAAQTKNQSMMESTTRPAFEAFARASILLSRRECAEGERLVDSLRSSPGFWRTMLYSYLAECQLSQGRTNDAIQSYEMVGKIADYNWGFKAVFYPKSLYQLGILYEKKGNKKLAVEHYEKLLAVWKNADDNLPELVDTKARLTKLKGVAAK